MRSLALQPCSHLLEDKFSEITIGHHIVGAELDDLDIRQRFREMIEKTVKFEMKNLARRSEVDDLTA
ncbi:MAG: hypothetical protein WEC00_03025, partial [Dongiaceae bacterium]